MDEQEPIRIELTAEQREAVHRASGQHVEAIDLVPDDAPASGDAATDGASEHKAPLRFKWRPSVSSGIPRQAWIRDDEVPPRAP
jgi:hypothetical protein